MILLYKDCKVHTEYLPSGKFHCANFVREIMNLGT